MKNGNAIDCLIFSPTQEDAEIQTFAEMLGGDSFQRLEFNQIVSGGSVVTLEKPSADAVWSKENGNWLIPQLAAPVNPDVDPSSISDEEKAEYAAYLARQESND